MPWKVDKTVFVKHHVWYLTIVYPAGKPPECYWSFHDRTGMSDEQAKTAFEREHFNEVGELVAQKMKRELHENLN
jgi:hypothetical protein